MLNRKQQQAVDQIEGPVMVVAGPGTGKTHLLAHRVANILTVTDADPSNILCLTFSEAGVSAMRKRLKSIIGLDANKIHVMTFHGFCNKIILENQDFMGVTGFEPAIDLEQMEVVRTILGALPADNPLSKASGKIFLYEGHLKHLFSWLKRENHDWKTIRDAAEDYMELLPNNQEFIYQRNSKYGQKGEPNKNKIAEETERMEKLIAGLKLFESYNKALAKRKLYDYDDMIQWVLAAFDRGENLLRRYQEQYLYILADEFQDTNGAQYALLKKLAGFWEVPNLFIVGDDDQSIFEFQGARIHNILNFVEEYSPEVIVLDENYRSGQTILDAAARVIDYNMIRLSQYYDKDIRGRGEASVKLIQYDTWQEEAADVVSMAKDVMSSGTVAILYSKHRQVFDLIKSLQNQNIPFSAKYTNDVFRTTSWKYLQSFMEYVQREEEHELKGDYLLFDWLHFPMFGISREEAVQTARQIRLKNAERAQKRKELEAEGLTPDLVKYTFFEELTRSEGLGDFIGGIVSKYKSSTLIEWFDWVLQQSGITGEFEHNLFELSVIRTLYRFIQGQVSKHPTMDINELMKLLTGMQENGIPMRVEVSVSRENAIELCSAHAAKGLEWDTVIMYDCSGAWEPGRGRMQFKLPPSVTFSGDTDADEASRRAFYVAMTRAKKNLVLTVASMNPDGKDRKVCQYWDEIQQTPEATFLPAKTIEQFNLSLFGDRRDNDQLWLPQEQVLELIDNFVLSPSSLHDYLECPKSFYYKHLLQVPYFESDAIQFGYALHEPLAILFRKSRHNSDRSFHRVDYLIEWYKDYMIAHRSRFTKEGYERLLPYGEKVLQEYYERNVANWSHYTQAEYRVNTIFIGDAPFKGVIDRMDFIDHVGCRVVDYKTGRFRKEDFEEPSEGTHGGKYWRQMNAYKLLVDRDPKESWVAVDARVSFLELQDSQPKEVTVSLDSGRFEEIVHEAWKGIRAMNFNGCGEKDCKFCNI